MTCFIMDFAIETITNENKKKLKQKLTCFLGSFLDHPIQYIIGQNCKDNRTIDMTKSLYMYKDCIILIWLEVSMQQTTF